MADSEPERQTDGGVARIRRAPTSDDFQCPYENCACEAFEDIDDWLDHQRDEHGVNGPL